MWKKIKKIFAFFSIIDSKIDEIKKLIDDFEEAYEDGKIEIHEVIDLLIQIITLFRSLFPQLRK